MATDEVEPVLVEPAIKETTTERPARSKNKGKRQVEWRQEANLEAVTAFFLACARCSYFLAGYQMIFNDLATAVDEAQDNWVTLSWNKAVRLLVFKSYGCQIDVQLLHYAGHCRECQRVFIYESLEEPSPIERLLVELRPR